MNTITILALSWQHLLIVGIIILIFFGGRKIPEMMRGLGSGIKEFKDAVKEDDPKKPEEPRSNSSTTP
ncbi:twin-arginine translocase TatA/TatE family subunit [Kaistella daneshvariae]|jgi:sec-independent protein translocase protein TatA|uniref:Sec-independent protein translocase protein TatA n=2 Tax=Kaistella TaxID=2782231 RepID=A0A3N0WT24_9FLAO|nr:MULTISPECIES: twin-arginine translocase TatA/TatE family subunit [Kaistella]AZI67209.1 twin-arginine translocase TatA/TatE family subunit [Kaistella daneshvariae]ROI08103.1 twin-arginine translocase TatA/TatE family subunit [Kaistella daneshvariae]SFI84720.1 sec-independent protein translocase protein TatA [Kaistella treverensis]